MNNITIEDLTNIKFLSELKYSPNGELAAFVVKIADMDSNDYLSRIWIYDFSKNEKYRLTSGKKDSNFIWLDNQTIVFRSKRDTEKEEGNVKGNHNTDLYKININGGEAIRLVTIPKLVLKYEFINENKILFTGPSDLKESLNDSNDNEEKISENQKDKAEVEILEEIPFWSNGEGFTSGKRTHLFLYDIEREKITDLIEGNYHLLDYAYTEDMVCLNLNLFTDKMEINSDLHFLKLSDRKLEKLTDNSLSIGSVDFKNEKTIIFTGTDGKISGLNTNREIYEYDLENNRLEKKTNLDCALANTVGTDSRLGGGYTGKVENENYYFITTEGYSSYLNCYDGKNVQKVNNNPGTIDMFDIKDGMPVYVSFRENKLQEIYAYKDDQETKLTDFNDSFSSENEIVEPEHFIVEASDGCKLDAWVIKPVNFKEGEKYPTILEIHGGPKTVYGDIYFHEFQILAAAGYAVVFSNPRGSDGRGNVFADIRGKYGTRDYQDLMEVLDAAQASYDFIDADRTGVTGGSYGGYMTNWIIGHTDRFKAAVSMRSISNWISMFNTTDIGYFFTEDQFAETTPWSDYEKLWEGSPLKYADQVTTPTLFIHSDEDYRCWVVEGIQMFTALKYHNVDSKMAIFKGENHELSRGGKPANRIRRLEEMLKWFDKYLKE